MKKGEITCIVVKDFSRFGRNYLEVGDYLEQVFPFLGVRFISINDGYDSISNKGITAGIDIGLKNLIYDLYSKDLSIKIKSSKLIKMKKGEYIGSFAPYGYIKSKKRRNTLEIDEEAAIVVRHIFELASKGYPSLAITKILNEKKVPSPAMHFRKNNDNRKFISNEDSKWNISIILKIIKNVTYLGKTVNHKRECVEVGRRKTVFIPPEKWIIVDNTHDNIISEEVFEKAQKSIKSPINHVVTKSNKDKLFYGKVKCGICKKAIVYPNVKKHYFKCVKHIYDGSNECFKGKVYEETLENILLKAVRVNLKIVNEADKLLLKIEKQSDSEITNLKKSIYEKKQMIKKLECTLFEIYEMYLEKKINKEEYFADRDNINTDIRNLTEQIERLNSDYEIQLLKNQESKNQFVETIKGFQNIEKLDKILIDTLVDTIYIYDEEHIEIIWKFADEYEKVLKLVNG